MGSLVAGEFPVSDCGMNKMKILVSVCLTGEKGFIRRIWKATYRCYRHTVMRLAVEPEK
jgi:hypothetical protein